METPALGPLPDFVRDQSWRELSPKEGGYRWRYVTQQAVRLPVRGLVNGRAVIRFFDAKGRHYFTIDRFGLLVEAGYAWNGCSPKRWVWPFGWMGTWDYPCTLLASLFHDALYQFHGTRHFPDAINREMADGIFREIIDRCEGGWIGGAYHLAVRKFGRWSYRPQGEYSSAEAVR